MEGVRGCLIDFKDQMAVSTRLVELFVQGLATWRHLKLFTFHVNRKIKEKKGKTFMQSDILWSVLPSFDQKLLRKHGQDIKIICQILYLAAALWQRTLWSVFMKCCCQTSLCTPEYTLSTSSLVEMLAVFISS